MADEFGTVVNVATVNVGEFLTASVAPGAAALPVSNVSTFDEKGGQVLIAGTVYSYYAVDIPNSRLLLRTSSGLLLALAGSSGTASPTANVGLNINGDGAFNGGLAGVHDSDYHYDGQASLNALYALGIRHVRFAIRMERLQPTPGAAFNSAKQTEITDYVARIAAAGLTCKVDVHNYGRRA